MGNQSKTADITLVVILCQEPEGLLPGIRFPKNDYKRLSEENKLNYMYLYVKLYVYQPQLQQLPAAVADFTAKLQFPPCLCMVLSICICVCVRVYVSIC